MNDEDVPAVSVGLPIYNEEENLPGLLDLLIEEPYITEIIAVDDGSDDASPEILEEYAARSKKVRAIRTGGRDGQLAAWVTAARTARSPVIAFVDADARPARSAIRLLAERITSEPSCVIASGRVTPVVCPEFPASRFRGEVIHRVRTLGLPQVTIIGRFFAVRPEWFLQSITRPDVIANDAYLGCLAERDRLVSRYVPEAVCFYTEASDTRDFAAQRQRADAGYRQLRELGLLSPAHEPRPLDYAKLLGAAAVRDPAAAYHWVLEQIKARFVRSYSTGGGHNGIWETQASTKRRLAP